MKKEIPKIQFLKNKVPDIQVLSFAELNNKLEKAVNHNPFEAHKIGFHLILIATNETYKHFVDFKSYNLSRGSALFIEKNQVHYFSNKIKTINGISLIINNNLIEQYHFLSQNIKLNRLFNYHLSSPVITASDMGEDSLDEIAKLLYIEYQKDKVFAKSEMLRTLLHVLLLRAERSKETCSTTIVKSHWLEIFNDFKYMLEHEYVENKNARYYAKKLLISYKFLNEIIKKLTKNTAKSFIDQYVTIEIKRYLASTSLSIKEIGYEVGFEEPANMVKFFKRNTGITPLSFRKQL